MLAILLLILVVKIILVVNLTSINIKVLKRQRRLVHLEELKTGSLRGNWMSWSELGSQRFVACYSGREAEHYYQMPFCFPFGVEMERLLLGFGWVVQVETCIRWLYIRWCSQEYLVHSAYEVDPWMSIAYIVQREGSMCVATNT